MSRKRGTPGNFEYLEHDDIPNFCVPALLEVRGNIITVGAWSLLWDKNGERRVVAIIRDDRYTSRLIDERRPRSFVLDVLDDPEMLEYCGTHSGKTNPKIFKFFEKDPPRVEFTCKLESIRVVRYGLNYSDHRMLVGKVLNVKNRFRAKRFCVQGLTGEYSSVPIKKRS